eukprot:CAMPEP_0174257836 /NCGR_PEP_ID=MMETSP0439-20130205/6944_1 /TAXON_ID=0 /ORGANISM="Stereomyxa ramosa, Strain Chinc5" /LENGTH=262 /DNA_ID=CAMNT_0015341115 /DNA_START=143 /DNA_END=928 /DNA_ORIENTATION=-
MNAQSRSVSDGVLSSCQEKHSGGKTKFVSCDELHKKDGFNGKRVKERHNSMSEEELREELKERRLSLPPKEKLAKFNVGGKKFITAYSTLFSKGENMLTALIDNDDQGKIPCRRDQDDYIFIDRSGDLFEIVLDYFRTGKIDYHRKLFSIDRIFMEFDYYQIKLPQSNARDFVSPFFWGHITDEELFSELSIGQNRATRQSGKWLNKQEKVLKQLILGEASKGDLSFVLSLSTKNYRVSPYLTLSTPMGDLSLPHKYVTPMW